MLLPDIFLFAGTALGIGNVFRLGPGEQIDSEFYPKHASQIIEAAFEEL